MGRRSTLIGGRRPKSSRGVSTKDAAEQPGDQPATPYLAAPATADIIIGPTRPSSIDRPQPQSLKWNRRWQQTQQVSFGARPR
jgi:hypothetical protein